MVLRFFLFASLFIFTSCSDVKFDNPDDPKSPDYIGNRLSSSSSVEHSFSSAEVYSSSSSSLVQNFSSAAESSSSSTPSSSSAAPPSSSSLAQSSSSAVGVIVPSSSSVITSVESCDGFVEGTPREHYGISKPQFCDSRDGKKYVYVKIGEQTWMAENLNYDASGSKCNFNEETNCITYGRLYSWPTAMVLPSICPTDWHIPSNADWNALMNFVNPNCSNNNSCAGAGTKLKATSGWNSFSNIPLGTDDYGFSALPGGEGGSSGYFISVGDYGIWWSSSEYDNDNAYYRGMRYEDEFAGYNYAVKGFLYSIRCLQD